MSRINPFDIVTGFNNAINSHDPGHLALLMSEDHVFTDSAGKKVIGKMDSMSAWQGFFKQCPDYKNIFDRMELHGNVVKIMGHSRCSDERLNGSALWSAAIKSNKIQEWHVYEDTAENRALLGM